MEDTSTWLTSKPLAEQLIGRRDNDVKVIVNDTPVPIASVEYDGIADQFHIELIDGEDLRVAMSRGALLEEALTELVRLKDGPRDVAYERDKEVAWSRARAALA